MTSYLVHHVLGHALAPRPFEYGDISLVFRGKIDPHRHINSTHVLLIVDAHNPHYFDIAESIVNTVLSSENVRSAVVLLKGSEKCGNKWLVPFLARTQPQFQSKLRAVMLVHGPSHALSSLMSEGAVIPIKQFPIGVATYRGLLLILATTQIFIINIVSH